MCVHTHLLLLEESSQRRVLLSPCPRPVPGGLQLLDAAADLRDALSTDLLPGGGRAPIRPHISCDISHLEAELPDELQALQRMGHLSPFVLQLRWSEVSGGRGGEAALLLPEDLQAELHQLQHTQQVQLARDVEAARAELRDRTRSAPAEGLRRGAPAHLGQLLHPLPQAPGDVQGLARPIQDVLVRLPLQNTLHTFLLRLDAGHHQVQGGPQAADLRTNVSGVQQVRAELMETSPV